MPVAICQQEPEVSDEVLPLSREIIEYNNKVWDLEIRLRNQSAGLTEAESMLADINTDLEKLDRDEKNRLVELAEAEAEERETKLVRDALDSIRGRRLMLQKKLPGLQTDQLGRAEAITKTTDELSAARNTRDQHISDWRVKCYESNEKALQQSANEALRKWFSWMIAAGHKRPQLHNPIWVRVHVFSGGPNGMDVNINTDGSLLQEKLNQFAMAGKEG